MSGFRRAQLGDCCEIVSGATPDTGTADYWEGDICWATPKDLSNLDGHYISDTPRKLTQLGLNNCSASILPPYSVLFSSRAPIGHVAINTVPMATNQGFKSFVPGKEVDAKFLFHWLRANRSYLEGLGVGATFKEVSKAVVSKVEVPVPPLSEQRRIAAILDKADALRTKRREALAQLDRLAQSIFVEMFGDPVANPKGWRLCSFNDACPTRLGKMLDQKQQTGQHARKYLRNANVQWFRLDLNDVLEMDFEESARETFALKDGDLLICEGGEPGRAAIWRNQLAECYYQKALHRGRPNPNLARSEYLLWLLWFLSKRGGLSDHVTSATIAHLTGEKLKAMMIPLPPLALQQSFVERLKAHEHLRRKLEHALESQDDLFGTLQHRAFRGVL